MTVYSTEISCLCGDFISQNNLPCKRNEKRQIYWNVVWFYLVGITEGIKEVQEICKYIEGCRDWLEMMEWWCPRSQGGALCHRYLLQQRAAGLEMCWKMEKISPLSYFQKLFCEVLCSEGTLEAMLGRQQWFCSGCFYPFPARGDVSGQESFSLPEFCQ